MEMPALDRHVFAVGLGQPRKVFFGSFRKTHMGFSTCGQRQAPFARLAADFFDKLLGLATSYTLALAPDHPMNPLAIDHYVDAEHAVAVSDALEGDTVFGQASPRAKRSH